MLSSENDMRSNDLRKHKRNISDNLMKSHSKEKEKLEIRCVVIRYNLIQHSMFEGKAHIIVYGTVSQ